MKKLAIYMVALALAFGLASLAAGSDQAIATKIATGKVVSVDAKAKTLMVDVEKKHVTLTIDAGTMIFETTQSIRLGDIKSGDRVAISYHVAHGKNMATNITLQST